MSKPSVGELVNPSSWNRLRVRPPRADSDGKKDNPRGALTSGQITVALGTAALLFARMRLGRIRKERTMIKQLWDARTSVRSLRECAERGEALPDVAMVRGWLSTRGRAIQAVSSQVPELRDRMGAIEQPVNYYLELAKSVQGGRGPDVPEDVKAHLDGIDLDKIEEAYTRDPGSSPGDGARGLAVSELLVTRLGCEARKKTTEDKNGKKTVTISRKPRQARFNAFHKRRAAEGLHLVGLAGEIADVELPEFGMKELRDSQSPPLFLSAPDALAEFRKVLPVKFINADKAFMHLSRFLQLDLRSTTDDGGFSADGGRSGRETALRGLGALYPIGWLWNGKGHYDNNSSEHWWMSHYGVEVVDFPSFAMRIATAREENSRHQDATKWSCDKMMRMRDEENCFRFAEVNIPVGAEVVVVGKPVYRAPLSVNSGGKPNVNDPQMPLESATARGGALQARSQDPSGITLCAPDKTPINEAQFQFRILQGHTAENLLFHRDASTAIFVGFAFMAMCTIGAGEEMIRDSLVVAYS